LRSHGVLHEVANVVGMDAVRGRPKAKNVREG
jgi:hypothetical protein